MSLQSTADTPPSPALDQEDLLRRRAQVRCQTRGTAITADTSIYNADIDALVARDTRFLPARDLARAAPFAYRPAAFLSVIDLILEQQVSVQAARAMARNLRLALVGMSGSAAAPATDAGAAAAPLLVEHAADLPDRFLALDDTTLRACGFTRQKMGYARGVAMAVRDGTLDLPGLADADDATVIATLTALKGIGRWTAECFLLFALRRRDVLPVQDLAIQVGWQSLAGAAHRPSARDMDALGATWSPYRTAASVMIWRWYLAERGQV